MHDCQCRDGHDKCRAVPYAPLRLLAVGLDGSPIRLVGRDSNADPTKYAALSYCWGKSLQLRTTKSTLAIFSEEVPSDLIPQTWTDAIHIARGLRISHIWIDALCIVQDDEAEWQREVEHMSEIYQGSVLTIVAVQSIDSSHGCFASSRADGLEDGELFFRTRPDNSLDGGSSIVRVYRNDIRDRAGGNTAISNRGWTLQEQLLSPRLVLCMEPEIHWQCRASYQTQGGLWFEPSEVLKGNAKLIPHYDHLQTGDQEYHNAWRRIVEGYSLREFSYSRDRIPAIAGITRYLSSVLDDVSILGLWRKSFAKDLAWLRGGGLPQMSNTTGLPSWTWLTSQGCVLYTNGDNYSDQGMEAVEHLKLLDWDVQWKGVPFSSPVNSAQVRIEGPVREIRIVPFSEGNRYTPPYFQVFEENLQPTEEGKIPWRCAGRFDAGDVTVAATYLCLLLLSISKSDDVCEVFLILEPVDVDNGMGTRYKRVGLARIWGESPTFDSAKTMSMIMSMNWQPKTLLARHRQLAPSASVRVSPLCLGAMNFGEFGKERYGECSKETAFEILDHFYSQGGNFIDTANSYQAGESEMWVGEWMKERGNRDDIVLATKYTTAYLAHDKSRIQSNYGGNGSKSMKLSVDASLKKLHTHYIDILYVHWWDYTTSIPELMHSLNDLIVAGKVLYLGISDAPAWVVSKANQYARSNGLRQFVVYQGMWNAALRDFERDIVPMCRDEGMGLCPYGTLGQGRFQTAANYAEREKSNPGRKFAAITSRDKQVSAVLEKIGKDKGVHMLNVALSYVRQKTPYVFPIVGGRKLEHIKGNIEGLEVTLTEEEVAEVESGYEFDPGFPHTFLSGTLFNGAKPKGAYRDDDVWLSKWAGEFDSVDPPKPISRKE
ncbi:hypothetical protein jhhlp_008827 [Lomentospora prolificans]|uniref:Heterokaryon incompatibility domain-containing protein n=1 Tax=Lomentospora prolificans TaxID=41688 RepID=A0A2N3MZ45_9PEZI|nr:hypothetical protein jhhlp_008827 [Lomentospora prolificans]